MTPDVARHYDKAPRPKENIEDETDLNFGSLFLREPSARDHVINSFIRREKAIWLCCSQMVT